MIDPMEDEWYFDAYVPRGQETVRTIHISFSFIENRQVKELVKRYALWRLGRVKPATLRTELYERIRPWTKFLQVHNIADTREFRREDFSQFCGWLEEQGLRENVVCGIAQTVVQLLRTGQRLGWRVTDEPLTEEHELWLRQFCTHDQKTAIGAGTTKPIPRDIYAKILSHAIRDEQDVITKSGILIQSQTGLRISEVLSLQENCLFKSRESGWQLCYLLGKTRRAEPVRHVLPAGELVVSAVQELMCATKALRQESGRTELFLLRNHGIRQVSETNWNRGRLRGFMMRWDIRDADGKIYELHSHQFRTTYVQRRLLAGDSIETLRQQLGHVSSEMTAQYAKLPQEELRMLLTHYMGKGEGD